MDKIDKNNDLGKFLYTTLINCYKETETLLIGVEKMLIKGADVNYKDPITGDSLLMISIENGLYHIFCLLLKYQADIEAVNKDKKNACYLAAGKEDPRFLKRLIKVGTNLDSSDRLSNTPINEAIRCCKIRNIEILIENGATLNLLNIFGDSIYDIAYETGNEEVIDYILNFDKEKDKKTNLIGVLKRILHR